MAPNANARPDAPKPLGVRANAEQRRILAEAAKREHRSVSSFVLQAALHAARSEPELKRRSPEEIDRLLAGVRAKFVAANPEKRDILAEFLAERRAEAAHE